MKKLFVLRGLPGSGKSTFIEKNGLLPYTICPDSIRMLLGGLNVNENGGFTIPTDCEEETWGLVNRLLERRLNRGILTILDSTAIPYKTLKNFSSLCSKYRVRMYVVDFTNVSLESCLERNRTRDSYKFVPEDVIIRMDNQLSNFKENNKFEMITSEKALEIINDTVFVEDANEYEQVAVFGDIHGCYTALKNALKIIDNQDKTLFVFSGDLFDRGIENKEVLQFCLDNCDKPNFVFVTGNHELHILEYLSTGAIATPAFNETIEQFGELNNKLTVLARRLRQMYSFTFNGDKFIVSHGGISTDSLNKINTIQYIKGVGKYKDSEIVDEQFCKNTSENVYSIHGHRNIYGVDVRNTARTFNLEGKVELGGELRAVVIDKSENKFRIIKSQNCMFNKLLSEKHLKNMRKYKYNSEILEKLDNSELIRKKQLENGIVSYNFSRDAFYKKLWDNLTTKARGLFIDDSNGNVIARSYDKFFNIDERPETGLRTIENSFAYPVKAYLKENGFLGLVSYNPKTDDLFIASKSTDEGPFKEYFKNILLQSIEGNLDSFKEWLKNENVTAIFECIDVKNDPHIIEYKHSKVVLLDIVKNDFTNTFIDYDRLTEIARSFGLEHKVFYKNIENSQELNSFLQSVKSKKEMEGFVLVDKNNFRVKYKLDFYTFWKQCRSLKDKVVNNKVINIKELSNIQREVVEQMQKIDIETLKKMSIIDVRNKFFECEV